MSEHDERPEGAEEDVEGHLIKEALAAGAAATAFVAASPAGAQVADPGGGASAAKAAQPDKRAPKVAEDPTGGAKGSRFIVPGPGGSAGQVAPGEGPSQGGKVAKKKAKKKQGRR
jgi:hypothetical protein